MAEVSPPSPEILVVIVGVVLYMVVWFATRNLSRVGKILARLAPLGLVIPGMVSIVVVGHAAGWRAHGTDDEPSAAAGGAWQR